MNPYLFVYGTLRNDAQNDMAAYLRDQATFLGEGRMAGKMFDLGPYPGAIYIKGADEQVSGHVFKMHRPSQVLAVLDEYEGVGDSFPAPNEYVREERPVLVGQQTLSCWVYLYQI